MARQIEDPEVVPKLRLAVRNLLGVVKKGIEPKSPSMRVSLGESPTTAQKPPELTLFGKPKKEQP